MKKVLFVILGFCSLFANAQKLDNSLLWKISGNGLSAPSYLYGTVHMTCNAKLDENTLLALDVTKQLYLELNIENVQLQDMMDDMLMKDGVTLSSLLSPEDYTAVNDFMVKKTGLPTRLINTIKPAYLEVFLSESLLDCEPVSIESLLARATKAQNEKAYGLETVEEQIAIFDAIPYKIQAQELVKIVKDDMKTYKKDFALLIKYYSEKNLNKLLETGKESGSMMTEYSDIFLKDRNKNWIAKIEQIAKETPTFFGVGAAHLPGTDGVIMLLRKKGYKVEAVK
ncbi:TraB/GumN family protein [Flavobacterium hauense]